ncbi:hypothetical protein FBUS_04634 [Fasciolopsis buskii]|uniref:Polycomb protein VEFS-Box domain-containing protein n=1 Tax=Fasciolopsis buskii TaxID=27845 RepID=A0A8E0RXP8_9TREM|nr:hypothetical protein FBUS_04634 [Fasciolopsis buski]
MQITRSSTSVKGPSKQDRTARQWSTLDFLNSFSFHWPLEVQMIFEGFYDSEKEVDWITVDASVNLVFRFGWSWRHKTCPSDTLVSPCQTSIPLACHHPGRGIDHSPSAAADALTDCRFCPLDVIDQAKWMTSGSRLSSGQLELRVNAVERRWLKRRDLNRAPVLPNSETASTSSTTDRDQTMDTISAPKSRQGLSGASYPVHYVTAPLPLFYPSSVSGSLQQSHPFLLTPGLYELRLGVDHTSTPHNGLVDKIASDGKRVPNGSGLENGAHDTASTSDSLVTSTSDFPLGTVCSSDEVSSLNSQTSGAVSGRVEWRRVRFPRASDALDEYNRWPTLKFRVVWHGEAETKDDCDHPSVRNGHLLNGTRDGRMSLIKTLPVTISSRNSFKSVRRASTELSPLRNGLHSPNRSLSKNEICEFRSRTADMEHTTEIEPVTVRPVAYRFLYMGHLQQWSESKNLICPWCQLDCGRARSRGLEALLIHLRSTHPRFRFKAFWGPSRTHLSLEVSLNEAYDGSNDCGLRRWAAEDSFSGHVVMAPGQLLGGWTGLGLTVDRDLNSPRSLTLAGCASRVSRPIRRLPYTHLIFWRGAERSVNQAQDPTLSVRPMAVGHNRVYYHTRSVQPIRACEFDVDSEAEDAPIWLCQHYQRKVEEFTDVNQGEKQIMQLWNSLLLSIGPSQLVVCDNQLVNLCGYFLHRHATTIHRRRLRNNLLLHFTNLVDYGLLSAGQLRQLMVIYDKMITNHTTLNNAANNTGGSSRAMIGSSINGTITMTDASSMRSIEA